MDHLGVIHLYRHAIFVHPPTSKKQSNLSQNPFTLINGKVNPPSTTLVKTTIARVVVIIKLRETWLASGKCKLCANATAPLKPKESKRRTEMSQSTFCFLKQKGFDWEIMDHFYLWLRYIKPLHTNIILSWQAFS